VLEDLELLGSFLRYRYSRSVVGACSIVPDMFESYFLTSAKSFVVMRFQQFL